MDREALEVRQHILHFARTRHEMHGAQERAQRKGGRRPVRDTDEIFRQQDANDIVNRAVVHGVARQLGPLDERHHLLTRGMQLDGDDLGSGGHDFARVLLGELQHAFQERRVAREERSALLASLHQQS